MWKYTVFLLIFCFSLHSLTLDEKIGQLFIAPVYFFDKNAEDESQPIPNSDYIEMLITEYHIGGILLKFYWEYE